jgi:YesN/AraC family two-component response regulator
MPKVDGVAIATRAKSISPKVKTVLLSGGAEDDGVLAALDARTVDRFANKPWHQDELVAIVDGLLAS